MYRLRSWGCHGSVLKSVILNWIWFVTIFLQLTRQTYFEADVIDQKKEEEEQALVIAEEKDRSKEKLGASSRPKVVISKTGKATSGLSTPSPNIATASSPLIAKRSSE